MAATTLIQIDGVLKLVDEVGYTQLIRSDQDFVLIGRIERKLNKNKITQEQGKLILRELEQNMKYFNNIPFGEIYNNFKIIILKNIQQ